VSYSKLFSSIVHSTIWREDNATRLVWITMLALCDQDGIVEASIPGLADAARVSLPECERALALLSSADPYSRSKEENGRRILDVPGGWRLVNYETYRDRSSKEEKRRKDAERQARHRDRRARDQRDMSRDVTHVTPGHEKSPTQAQDQDQDQIRSADVDPKDLSGSARAVGGPDGSGSDTDRGPIQARAKRCLANPHDAAYEAPEAWPEVLAVVEAYRRATGQPGARLGTYARDRGVQAVVGLLADGYTVVELELAVARAVSGDWWSGGTRGLSSLSPEVVRRALASESPLPGRETYEYDEAAGTLR